ncbi:MAG: triose-phosphate isomerase [Clostridia bacterium]|nr:triose-phosphate isomerase [Deltaproteobacteria bacterium]
MASRRPLIAGNWKCNKTVHEALALVTELKNGLASVRDVDVVIAPPLTALWPVHQRLQDTNIGLAAQEVYYQDSGAYTGKVSAPMVKEAGCTYVIVGHSERRQLFHETNESANKRVKAVLRAGITPILCVGETLEEREAQQTESIVADQIEGGIAGLSNDELAKIVIAYEPVWAIGTGKVATPRQAQDVHRLIRDRLRAKHHTVGESLRLLYGGSVKPDNAKELIGEEDIDGALVGGASLNASDFIGIVKAARGSAVGS